jgi:hypothetical protein
VRASLELMRDNEAAVLAMSDQCRDFLLETSVSLKILNPEHGEEELIKLVAAELAKLSLPLQQPGALVLCTTPTGVPRS